MTSEMAPEWNTVFQLRYYSNVVRPWTRVLIRRVGIGLAAMAVVCAILFAMILLFGGTLHWGAFSAIGVATFLAMLWCCRSSGEDFRPYCGKCEKDVAIKERIIGMRVEMETIRNPPASDIVKALLKGDCSPLSSATPLRDWWKDLAVFIGMGRCDTCSGPFILFGEIHGVDAATNTLHLGTVFITEVDEKAANGLMDAARQRGLVGASLR